MTKLISISLLTMYFLVSTNCHGQGKWSMGFDMASRSEWRKYEDSYRYLFKGSSSVFSFGGSISYQHNERWRFESGLISTPYSRTIAVYYNEPGYKRMLNRPLMYIGHTNMLEVPIKAIYSAAIQWKAIQFNIVGGDQFLFLS